MRLAPNSRGPVPGRRSFVTTGIRQGAPGDRLIEVRSTILHAVRRPG
jgi:hypothetical protein